MKQTELKYLTSVGLFGTIGVMMLHYISLPSEVVVITRDISTYDRTIAHTH